MYRPKSTDVWFNLPGVQAAYMPIAAPDPFAARQNVAHQGARFGVYTATSGVAPTWGAARGWGFTAASTQYLRTGIIPADAWSVLLRIANATNSTQIPFGVAKTGSPSGGFYLIPCNGGTNIQYANGTYTTSVITKTPSLQTGVLGFSAKSAYRNGVNEATISSGAGAYGAFGIFIGAANVDGSPLYYFTGSIPAALIVSRTLSPAEMWLASRQMAYCDINPDWNAWARKRMYFYAPSAAAAAFNPAWARNANTVINQVNL